MNTGTKKRKLIPVFLMICLLMTTMICQGAQTSGQFYAPGAFAEKVVEKAEDSSEDSSEESSGSWIDYLADKASELAEKAGRVVEGAKGLFGSAREIVGGLFEDAKEKAGDTVDSVKEKAGAMADTVQNTVSDTVDTVKEKAGAAADAVQNTVSDAADTVQSTVSDAADTVQETVDSVKDTISDVTDTVQETAGKAADAVKETAQEAQEQFDRIAEKWDRVLAYLKEKFASAHVTDEEWGILRKGYDRAVRNAYRAGWFGENSEKEIEQTADNIFESIRYTYLVAKKEITPAEYGKALLELNVKNISPQMLSGFIESSTGLDPRLSDLAAEGIVWLVRKYLM